jgi:hypothetical protein
MFVFLSGGCLAYQPVFRPGVYVEANGSPLDVTMNDKGYSAPNVCDWNNDGRKDLLVGQFWDGKVRLYLNSGTDSLPVFTTYTYLQAGGVDIAVGHY